MDELEIQKLSDEHQERMKRVNEQIIGIKLEACSSGLTQLGAKSGKVLVDWFKALDCGDYDGIVSGAYMAQMILKQYMLGNDVFDYPVPPKKKKKINLSRSCEIWLYSTDNSVEAAAKNFNISESAVKSHRKLVREQFSSSRTEEELRTSVEVTIRCFNGSGIRADFLWLTQPEEMSLEESKRLIEFINQQLEKETNDND